MDFDDVAGGIVEEDLIPSVHRPLAVIGVGNVFLLEAARIAVAKGGACGFFAVGGGHVVLAAVVNRGLGG